MKYRQQNQEVRDRTIRVYNAMLIYYAEHGRTPSVRELCALCDISSTSMVNYYLALLEEWEWIKRDRTERKGASRVLRLTRLTERDLNADELKALLDVIPVPAALPDEDVRRSRLRSSIKPFNAPSEKEHLHG